MNFLIDEAVLTGKGANGTISLVHYYFEKFGLGETEVHLHADNCSGQNKNNYFLWYYAWRIITDLHWEILYSFLPAGHTKFAPKWCFGLGKQAIRKTYIYDLFELDSAIENSSVTGVNITQLCGLHDGQFIVKTYDWVKVLEHYFKKLPGIKGYHHFRFSKSSPGHVFCRRTFDSAEEEYNLLRNPENIPPRRVYPTVITPVGIDLDRKKLPV